jgi:hypothetical protein
MTTLELESERGSPDDPAVEGNLETRRESLVRHASETLSGARTGAQSLIARVLGAVQATQTSAQATTKALQKLPDSTLRWLAASSVGLGAGLYLAGKRRIAFAAGVAPALMLGAAVVLRPVKPVAPTPVKP